MSDINSFLPLATAVFVAQKIEPQLTDDQRNRLLLWKAYLKRIKPVPGIVYSQAATGFTSAYKSVIADWDYDLAERAMDKLGSMLWNQLDEAAQREWLLKVV